MDYSENLVRFGIDKQDKMTKIGGIKNEKIERFIGEKNSHKYNKLSDQSDDNDKRTTEK